MAESRLVQVQDGAADLEFRGACVIDTITISIKSRRVIAKRAVSDGGSRELADVGGVSDAAAVFVGRVAAKSAVDYDHRSDGEG